MSKPIATLRRNCSFCGKVEVEEYRRKVGTHTIVKFECGHARVLKEIKIQELEPIVAKDGKVAYPYQMRSMQFFEECDLNGICAHEMGVGKTTVATGLVKRNAKRMVPVLYTCKSGLRYQAFLDWVNWTGFIPQVIMNGNQLPHTEYFPVIIISYDSLRLVRPDVDLDWERKNMAGLPVPEIRWTDEICARFKSIIMDECQMIKNPNASRTRALKKIASAWNRLPTKGTPPKILALSGTPIKNDAAEYAPVLHMVNPTLFPSEMGFIARDCYPIGSRFRLRNPEAFHEKTKNFILRYTRAEVLPELPAVFRMFRHAEMDGSATEKYKAVIQEFQKFMQELEDISMKDITNILGYFSRMRRITGAAKVDAALEFIEEFLESTDRKIVIFVHHKDTGNMLYNALLRNREEVIKKGETPNSDEPLLLISSMDMRQRQDAVNQFKGVTQERIPEADGFRIEETPTGKNHRVMIASTLAAGEGLNLQFCSDCLIMERQWNPSNEEQAEARFPRPGQKADKINATYLIAAGTIDDFLTELVEKKRSIVHSTLDNVETSWDESSMVRDLARVLADKGMDKWKA